MVRTLDGRRVYGVASSSQEERAAEVETLVLVDFGPRDPGSESMVDLLEDVNRCTAADHIRVRDATDPRAARLV